MPPKQAAKAKWGGAAGLDDEQLDAASEQLTQLPLGQVRIYFAEKPLYLCETCLRLWR